MTPYAHGRTVLRHVRFARACMTSPSTPRRRDGSAADRQSPDEGDRHRPRQTFPPPPPVSDPLLSPVPSPLRVISSWPEAEQMMAGAFDGSADRARDRVLQAEGETMVAFAQYLPAFGMCAGGSSAPPGCGNGSYVHQILTRTTTQRVTGEPVSGVLPVPDTVAAGLTISQNIINVQEFDQISIQRACMETSGRMNVDDTKRTLELSLANQIVAVLTAERSAEINRVGLRVALEQLELSQRKVTLGVGTTLDLVRARQNAANAHVSLVGGDEALRQAREGLGLTLGIPGEIGVAPTMDTSYGLAKEAMRSCVAVSTVDQRPDVAAARTNLEVAKRNLRNTWYSFIPVLTAQSTLTATTAPNFGYPNPTWSVGAVLSFPLFDGGTRVGQMESQRATAGVAAQALEALRRKDIVQIEQTRRGVEVADLAYKAALDQRDLAAQNDSLTQTAYMKGQGTSVDLVTASEAHRGADQTHHRRRVWDGRQAAIGGRHGTRNLPLLTTTCTAVTGDSPSISKVRLRWDGAWSQIHL